MPAQPSSFEVKEFMSLGVLTVNRPMDSKSSQAEM
jgi:hypothetical protein